MCVVKRITSFCRLPEGKVDSKIKLGGTKNPKIQKIVDIDIPHPRDISSARYLELRDGIFEAARALEELAPMEVSFGTGEASSEVVPVSFETVVTETGMLQLWCVSRDGRRWKLEFNVREKVQA